jgi:hypothetical protein
MIRWHNAAVEIEDILRCLADADADRRRPELCDGRFVYLARWPDDFRDPDDDYEDDDFARFEETSLYDALDRWASDIVAMLETDDSAELTEEHRNDVPERDYDRWLWEDLLGYAPLLRDIHSPSRLILAYYILEIVGLPMSVDTTDFVAGVELDSASGQYHSARTLISMSAAPPHHDEWYAILQCQPTGAPTAANADLGLLAACRDGDPDAVAPAVAAGADVNKLDERGMTALHVAVAHRHLPVVRALLAAGADPTTQAEYGNAAQFAALRDGEVLPVADRVEDPIHQQILEALLDAGAPPNAASRTAATLTDLAIRTRPYPKAFIDRLLAAGAGGEKISRARISLSSRLEHLPAGSTRLLETFANEMRFLLETGTDPNLLDGDDPWDRQPALYALLAFTGYGVDDVPPDLLLELVDTLLEHGAGAGRPDDLNTAIEHAQGWVDHGFGHYAPIVERLRAAHGQARAVS